MMALSAEHPTFHSKAPMETRILLALVAPLFVLAACGDAKQPNDANSVNSSPAPSASTPVEDGFRSSFKTSFAKSCSAAAGGIEQAKVACECVANELVANLSMADLTSESKVMAYVNDVAGEKCMVGGN